MNPANTLAPLDPRQRYTIEEAGAYLRSSRAKLYIDIKAGRIAVIKDGRRTYVPGTEIAARSALTPHSERAAA